MPKIFVSYRRGPSDAITGRIRDRLALHFGEESIFMDIDNIYAGMDFRKRINQMLEEAHVVVAVVGPKWLGPLRNGSPRIMRENDWVRLELESALQRNLLVVPVLVDEVEMPDASELPASLKDFVFLHAETVASGRDFRVHVDRLIRSIDKMLAGRTDDGNQIEPEHKRREEVAVTLLSPEEPGAISDAEPVPSANEIPVAIANAASETCETTEKAGEVAPVSLFDMPPPRDVVVDTPSQQQKPASQNLIQRWKYAAVVAAVALLAATTAYRSLVHFYYVASVDPAVIVPSPGSKTALQVEPAMPPDSASPSPVASPTTLALPNPPAVPVAPPIIPSMKSSCLAGQAVGVGGPLNPASIRPNFTEAREVRAVAVSPTGAEIATAGEDGRVRIWDLSSFKLLRTLTGHDGAIYSLSYWKDGSLLATASVDGTVRVWNANGKTIQTFDTRLVNGGNPVKQFSVAFYPNEPLHYILSGGEDGIVRIWNTRNGTLERARDQQGLERDKMTIRSLSFEPKGTGEFVTGTYDGKIRIYLTTKGQVTTLLANARKVLRAEYSPDSSRIVSAGSDGDKPSQNIDALKIWNVKTGLFQVLRGHRDYVVSASWSSDGKRLVSGGGGLDKSVILWDAEKGEKLAVFSGHQSDVEAVAFFASDTRMVSVGEDKTIRIWNVSGGKEILTAVGFGEREYLLYTPAGCYFGSPGIDNRINASYENKPAPLSKDLYVSEGFGSLLVGR